MEQSYGNDYSSYYDWFMRDYLTVKTGSISKIGMVYDAFKDYVQGGNAPQTITEVVEDIHKYSGHYVNMVLHKEPDTDLRKAFKSISKLKVDVSYPYFLPVYNDYVDGVITKEDLLEIISLVESYVFRRAICGIPTNSMNKTFLGLYKSVGTENYVESVKASFQLLESYKRFPTNSEFQKEMVLKDVYNFRSRNYLLAQLENHKRKELVNVDDYTIEHILPQNSNLSSEWQSMLGENWKEVQETYLHTIGNLTLTGYNSELSDRPFSQKKTIVGGFNDSPIRLNEFMRRSDKWTEEEIIARAKFLGAKAADIWRARELSAEELEPYRPKKKVTESYSVESYDHLKGDILELHSALRKRIMNIDSSVYEVFNKLYIAYKSSTNFVDIVPQKSRLRISLNMPFASVVDPKGLCKDITGIGRWGNGDTEVGLSDLSQLDDVMELIQQAFDLQLDK